MLIIHLIVGNIQPRGHVMAEEMKGLILAELRRGPRTDDELRRTFLGERPQGDKRAAREYDTKYQAFRRALEDLAKKGQVSEGRYKLRGEVVDGTYLTHLLKRYSDVKDDDRLTIIIQDVAAESGKVGAVSTPGLIELLSRQLGHSNPEIRKMVLTSLRNLTSNLDDDEPDDRKSLREIAVKFTPLISKLVMKDQPNAVRIEAIQ